MELSDIRKNLDFVDKELLHLFLQRMELVDKVADIKKTSHQPLYDPKREREILAKIRASAGEPYGIYAEQLYRTILELSRARQATQLFTTSKTSERIEEMLANEHELLPQSGRIACFGTEGSNTQNAADRMFSHGDLLFFDSFSAVVKAVQSGLCRFGVLPIETSANGSIGRVYDLLRGANVSIVRGVRLNIRHVLLGRKDADLSQIRTIYTHEQATVESRGFLDNLANVDVIPCQSTAHAARRVAEANDPSVAAIASEKCAKLYDLDVLAENIHDNAANETRFICIEQGAKCYAGANRLSLVLTCENVAGALFQTIAKISALGINMCKLESVPIPETAFSYRFYVDLDASLHQDGVSELLSVLEHSCESFQLLGSYSEIVG